MTSPITKAPETPVQRYSHMKLSESHMSGYMRACDNGEYVLASAYDSLARELEQANAEIARYKTLYEAAVVGRQQFRASFMAHRAFSERYQKLRDGEDGTFAVFMPRVHGHIAFSGEALDQKIDAHFGLSTPKSGDEPEWREGGIDLQIHNNTVTVSVERNGKFFPVIETYHGGITSHAVWPSGINAALKFKPSNEVGT